MKTKKENLDSKMKALLEKIPKGETMIITKTKGKTAIFITRKRLFYII